MSETRTISIKPFLRWAGGKRWLVDYINCQLLDEIEFNTYHEPFLGGGALFFSLNKPPKSFLSDLNPNLISTYEVVKNEYEKVVDCLKQFKNTEIEYYSIRNKKYRNEIKRAAQFIYLNNYSFNGIYRVNLQGIYNVPYGFRKISIDYENLKKVSRHLLHSELYTGDFGEIVKKVKAKDLVFLDPPYTVAHNKNGFIKYNQKIFSLEDQYRLADVIQEIKNIGAYFILTNAAHKTISSIFSGLGRKLIVSRNSLIGGSNAERGKVEEYVFTNIK